MRFQESHNFPKSLSGSRTGLQGSSLDTEPCYSGEGEGGQRHVPKQGKLPNHTPEPPAHILPVRAPEASFAKNQHFFYSHIKTFTSGHSQRQKPFYGFITLIKDRKNNSQEYFLL